MTRPRCQLVVLAAFLGAGCAENEQPPAPVPGKPRVVATKLGIEMVLIPAGEFVMGDDDGEDDERPAHKVKVAAFYIDRFEVTQKAYTSLTGANRSRHRGDERPAEQVTWLDAARYCNSRSAKEGLKPCYNLTTLACDFAADGYRLPTEAEWERACRAGTTSDYAFGTDPRHLRQHAWFKANAQGTTHPVGQKQASPWGLYDMQGNVSEWCNDFYDEAFYPASESENPRGPASGKYRVLRGGNWDSSETTCRSSARHFEAPGFADVCFRRDAVGFRCVRACPQ